MKLLEHLKEKRYLIVTPHAMKEKILKAISQEQIFCQVKFMDLEEFLGHFYFSYDLAACSYLMEHYHYKLDVCKVYLENMRYLTKKEYQAPKLSKLNALKEELLSQGLLQKDVYFSYYLKQVEVLIYGYSECDKWIHETLEEVRKITLVCVIEEEIKEHSLPVYAWKTLEEEVDFVAVSILELVKQGVQLSQVKLLGVSDDYTDVLRRIFNFYHLPLAPVAPTLYSTPYGKKFLALWDETEDFRESYNQITELYKEEVSFHEALLPILEKLNTLDCSKTTKTALLLDQMKSVKVQGATPEELIQCLSIDDYLPQPNDYVFVLGVNQNEFPKLYKDEDYITDALKGEVCLSTTEEKNKLCREFVIKQLYAMEHVVLTYKKQSPYQIYLPSSILDELQIERIENGTYPKYRYSRLKNQLTLATLLDHLRKTHETDPDIGKLYQSEPTFSYLTYQNQFTGIDNQDFLDFIHHKLLLSYTSMNTYHLCGFRYYINYILHLDPFTETFSTFIGNLYHKLLSMCFLADFNLDEAFQNYIASRESTVEEAFFLKKLKNALKETIEVLTQQKTLTTFREELYEKEIYLTFEEEIPVTFKGTIDKILYQRESARTLVALIDYKTGAMEPSISLMPYGIGMQLPIYWYLVTKSHLFPNPTFAGIYLEKVLHNEQSYNQKEAIETDRQNRYKLCGYSTDDPSVLAQFDKSYENSDLIQGMKLTSKGFAHYTKLLSSEEVEAMVDLVDQKIKETMQEIIQAKFPINPKKIGKDNISCKYCSFADLCYHQEEDVIFIEKEKDLSFLKAGEQHA